MRLAGNAFGRLLLAHFPGHVRGFAAYERGGAAQQGAARGRVGRQQDTGGERARDGEAGMISGPVRGVLHELGPGCLWQQCYAYCPVLLETFVEQPRFTGTAYQAANWQRIGQTKGRGKLDVHHRAALPRKSVCVYPLRRELASANNLYLVWSKTTMRKPHFMHVRDFILGLFHDAP